MNTIKKTWDWSRENLLLMRLVLPHHWKSTRCNRTDGIGLLAPILWLNPLNFATLDPLSCLPSLNHDCYHRWSKVGYQWLARPYPMGTAPTMCHDLTRSLQFPYHIRRSWHEIGDGVVDTFLLDANNPVRLMLIPPLNEVHKFWK